MVVDKLVNKRSIPGIESIVMRAITSKGKLLLNSHRSSSCQAHRTHASGRAVHGSLCSCFFLFITLAVATFLLHPHALVLAILRTPTLVLHMRNFLIDARCETLDTGGLGE